MNKFTKILLVIVIILTGGSIFYVMNKNNDFINLQNPGNCISAKSQCNSCSRDNEFQQFTCTEMVCENEKFVCMKYAQGIGNILAKKYDNLGEKCDVDLDCFCNEDPEEDDNCDPFGFILTCKDNLCSFVFESK